MRKYRLVEAVTGRCLLPQVLAAERFLPRLLGLMGKRGLEPGTGLFFPQCSSIHMLFMRFPIDAVYVAGGEVKKVVHRLKPWRISWCPGAEGAIEAAAGWAEQAGLSAGTRIRFEQWAEAQP